MIPPMSATRAALLGMQASLRKFEHAADVVSRAGLDDDTSTGAAPANDETAAAPGFVPATGGDDFLDAMVDMMVAQRAFSAQLRVLETANDMTKEAIELGGSKR